MEQIYRIKYLHDYEGKSMREVAEETGHHFLTVKKYATTQDFNYEPKPPQKRAGKLDPFKPLIDQWLKDDLNAKPKQRHTAQRIYNRLREIYGDEFNVSDRAVRKYVAKRRQEMSMPDQGYIPLKHPPGEAQADFGEAEFYERGIKYEGYYLNLSLPYSNAGYLQLFKGQSQECLLEGLKAIFEHMGCVSTFIWFDNMSAIVKAIGKDSNRDLTKGFERFMLHHGFFSNFCNPESAHEKGNVENKVGYHRRNMLVPIPRFNDLKEFNKELLRRCDEDMQRKHYKKGKTIAELFEKDRAAMNPLPNIPFEIYKLEPAKADKYGKVRFGNCLYSSSPALAGQEVWVKATASRVIILNQEYEEVVAHDRLYGKQKESMKWSPYLELMARRPRALKYTEFFNQLPSPIQEFFDRCSLFEKKRALKLLAKIAREGSLERAIDAFSEAIKSNVYDHDSLWAIYTRLTSDPIEIADATLPDKVPELKGYSPDITVYDRLLGGGR